ncbi:MAG: TolC family protein [Pseudomonadota bacterium]
MTRPFKSSLLSGVAIVALAIGFMASEPGHALAEDGLANQATAATNNLERPVLGRLDRAPTSGAELAPEWLGDSEAVSDQASANPAPDQQVTPQTDGADHLADAYAKAEAMAAALTDNQILDSKEWLADQLAELSGEAKPVVTEDADSEAVTQVPAALTKPLQAVAQPLDQSGDPQLDQPVAEIAEAAADEAVSSSHDAEAGQAAGATEIFNGDVPVKTELVILSPVPVPVVKPATPAMPVGSDAEPLGLTISVDESDIEISADQPSEAEITTTEVTTEATTDATVLATASGLTRDFEQVAQAAIVDAGQASGTVSAIINLAIQNHPRVLGDRASVRASREALREQRSDFFPTLSLEASSGYRNTDNRTTRARPTRGPGGDPDVTGFANEGTFRLQQLLFDFFATPNLVDAARQRLSQSQFVEADSQEQIGLRAIEAYLLVQQFRRNASFARDNVDFHVATLEDIQRRAEAGAGDSGDVSQTESRLALAREVLLGFEEQLAIAQADFKEAVGSMPGELGPLNPPTQPIPDTVGEAVTIATEENPFITASRFNAHGLAHEVEAATGDLYPRFDADVSYNRGHDVDGLGGSEEETRALVRMVWDLPTGGAEFAARKRLMREKEAAEQETEERFRLIEEEVRSSYAEVTITEQQIEQLADRVDSANAVVDAYQRQFEAGRRTLLDLLDSENERFLSRVSLNNGQSDLIRANYRLFTAMGRLRQVLDLDNALVDPEAE